MPGKYKSFLPVRLILLLCYQVKSDCENRLVRLALSDG